MTRKPKMLLVTPRLPFPPIGGDRFRIFSLAKYLAQSFDISLVSICSAKSELHEPVPDHIFTSVERFYLPKWRSVLNAALAVPTSTPLQNAYFWSNAVARRIKELAVENDILFAHLIRGAQYIENAGNSATVIEMTDAISMNYSRIKNQSRNRGFLERVFAFEADRLLKYELHALTVFDHISLISEHDKRWLEERGGETKNVSVNSVAYDCSQIPFTPNRFGEEIIFIGNMNTVQNMDAAMYFAEEVLPLVRQENSCVTLKVIGACSKANLVRLNRVDGVMATGRVENIAAAAENGFCGVCMLQIGAGVQNKILEYMALGLPAVVNGMGLEGLSAKPGIDLIRSDQPVEAAERILSLHSDPQRRRGLASNALGYLKRTHAPHVVAETLVNNLFDLLP